MMRRRLTRFFNPRTTLTAVHQSVEEEWNNVSQNGISDLYDDKDARVQVCPKSINKVC